MKTAKAAMAVAALFAGTSLAASAATYSFSCFTNNDPGSCTTLTTSQQIKVDVTNPADDDVRFMFTNSAGGIDSTIANVYFQSNLLDYGSPVITNSAGVNFASGGAPNNLPSGNTLSPPFSADYRASATSPAAFNGVDPGEQLVITLDLMGGATFQQLLDSFDQPTNGDSRIGLHVISVGDQERSESMILEPGTTVIPVPAALPLMLGGLFGLGLFARRRRVDGN